MKKPQYTIAVTGLNAVDSPGPGMGVMQSLRKATSFDVRIIGLSYESLEPCIYMHDLVDKTYQLPYPSAGQDILWNRLAYINSVEGIDFLFPNFDAELFNFIRISSQLEHQMGIKTVLPTREQFEARLKVNLEAFGEENGLLVPHTRMLFSANEIPEVLSEFEYPVAIKGQYYDARICYSREQVQAAFHKISAKWSVPILVQEFVRGMEVNVCGIGDGKGNTLGAVPMRKLYITDQGKAWAGVSLDDARLLELTHQTVSASQWRGAFELEFIKTEEDDYYLLEINPRFPAWSYLTTGAGQNQVETLVNFAMHGQAHAMDAYQVGKMFIRFSQDMIVDMGEFERISTMGEL